MRSRPFPALAGALLLFGALLDSPVKAEASGAAAVLPVSSPAFFFSPGNWSGDAGRAGNAFRQSWNPGAYFRVTWTTTNPNPSAELLLDTSSFGDKIKNPPELTYCLDGVWTAGVKVAAAIPIKGLTGAGAHTLEVYFSTSEQIERWGTASASGMNVVRVTGLRLNRDSTPVPAPPLKRWVLIIGDSITEGSAANNGKSDNLAAWSYFVGVGLQTLGYEYGVSACGYSGWLSPGDSTRDVPPYYSLGKSVNGIEGPADDARRRWNKIDARTSLLDARQRLSAYGAAGQEPAAILINYGTNDARSRQGNNRDLQASITRSLQALQKAAPRAAIFVVVPFGQYGASELKAGVAAGNAANPDPARPISLIDLGPAVARGLDANGYWSGLHPNMRAHATFAAQILARISPALAAGAPPR